MKFKRDRKPVSFFFHSETDGRAAVRRKYEETRVSGEEILSAVFDSDIQRKFLFALDGARKAFTRPV